MPLPEKVVEQIGREPVRSPGWSFGIISFSAGILAIVLFLWAGLAFGYKPYLDAQTAKISDEINQQNQLISPTDQTNLINYYSQIANLRTLLRSHQTISQAFAWLEKHTQANAYYSSFALTNGNQLTLTAEARSQNDANQQIAIFESSPDVQQVTVSGMNFSTQTGFWEFNIGMTLAPSVFAGGTP